MKKKILIIDDEKDMQAILSCRLRHQGYNTKEADNGQDGLNKLMEDSFDLIILDLLMPAMDGYEFCSKIKAYPKHAAIPIIILTAGVVNNPAKLLDELKAQDLIFKPFSSDDLQKRIKYILE